MDVGLHLLVAKLVVEHATESDAVAEDLETRDLSAPDEDRCNDEQDILEDTAKSEDEAGGFANLGSGLEK